MNRSRVLRRVAIATAALLLGAAIAGCTPTSGSSHSGPSVGPTSTSPSSSAPAPTSHGPNIVFVLTDDLATNLVQYMPHVLAMEHNGVSFSNYTVTDSLCCPSRASILTGDYPHDTGVLTNGGHNGGNRQFDARGDENSTFAVALHDAGYRTALMGKYLNGYEPGASRGQASQVPPGWDEWDAAGKGGYDGYDYDIAHGQSTSFYGHQPQDYLTSLLSRRATSFIASAAASTQPFFLEVSTFTPHEPYVPAPEDTQALPGVVAPRSAAFDTLPTHPPAWLKDRTPLTGAELNAIDRAYRLRAQDVLSVDRLIGSIEDELRAVGETGNTVLVFSSDNGLHMGEYRLNPGKMTAYDTDVNVPLVVQGPGILSGVTDPRVVQNVDLAPTFEALAGLQPSSEMDGSSILDLLEHGRAANWTRAALIEHHGPDTDLSDPDYPELDSGNPPSYEALRTTRYTYVEYATGGIEYYDRASDPLELHNIASRLSPARLAELHQTLVSLESCHGAAACSVARDTG